MLSSSFVAAASRSRHKPQKKQQNPRACACLLLLRPLHRDERFPAVFGSLFPSRQNDFPRRPVKIQNLSILTRNSCSIPQTRRQTGDQVLQASGQAGIWTVTRTIQRNHNWSWRRMQRCILYSCKGEETLRGRELHVTFISKLSKNTGV